MAFLKSGWGKISATGNDVAPKWFTYVSTTDTIATIKASAYFNSLVLNLTAGVGELRVNDVIHAKGSDSYALLVVTAVTTNVTVAEFSIALSDVDSALLGATLDITGNSNLKGDTNVFGNDAKTSYNKITGWAKFDTRPTGGSANDYSVQIRMESGKTSGSVWGLDNETHMKASGTASVRGVQGVAVLDSTYTATGATYIGSYAQARADGTFAGSGFMAASYALIEASAAITASHVCSLWLDSHQANAVTGSHQLAYMTNNGAAVLDEVMYVYAPNTTAFMELNTCTSFVSATAETGGSSKKIKITIDGVTHYINAYTG